jgi:hypothetical protein
MHARAHGIPTTPLTADTSTALLSTMLTVKPEQKNQLSNCGIQIKEEPIDLSEPTEPMESYSMASSRNPSPGSVEMDDEDL